MHNCSRGNQGRIIENAPSGAKGCSPPRAIPPPYVTGDSCSATAGGGLQWRRPWQANRVNSEECLPATHVGTQIVCTHDLKIGKKGGQGQGPAGFPNPERDVPPAVSWPHQGPRRWLAARPRANQGGKDLFRTFVRSPGNITDFDFLNQLVPDGRVLLYRRVQ
jgi:hypothetical protein